MSKITVVIPNYNGKRFLFPCMSALCAQTYADFDVLIVDNGSTDGSQDWIRACEAGDLPNSVKTEAKERTKTEAGIEAETATQTEIKAEAEIKAKTEINTAAGVETPQRKLPFPVRGIFLPENTGFSGAVNAGIAAADGDYVVLLNNDTEAAPGYLKALARLLDRDHGKRIFAVTPKMVQLCRRELLDDAGDGYCLLGWAFQHGVGRNTDTPQFNRTREVFSACAGAAAYRKEVLEKLLLSHSGQHKEYFDEQHFAYLEDVDLSYRARIRGYRIIYCPEAVVYHVGSGTSGSRYNAFKVRLAARNNLYLCYKNMPLGQLLFNLPGLVIGTFIKQIFFCKIGFGREYRQGIAEGFRTLSSCRKQPFRIQNLGHYGRIELWLLADTFAYTEEFLARQANKRRKRNKEGRKAHA